MNFKETLEFASENGINHLNLMIATEIAVVFEDVNSDEFEQLCYLVRDTYLKSSETTEALVLGLHCLVVEQKKNIYDISKRDLLKSVV